MTLDYIYNEFKKLISREDKIVYLIELKEMNLPYDINWDRLIEVWRGE